MEITIILDRFSKWFMSATQLMIQFLVEYDRSFLEIIYNLVIQC